MSKKTRAGYSLIEILLSLALFAIMVTSVSSLSSWLVKTTETEANRSRRNLENFEMAKILSQPVVFGALGNFEENVALLNCMKEDEVVCDTRREYELIFFDVSNGKKLQTVSTSRMESVKSEITFKVHCSNNESECDKATYFSVNIKTYLTYLGSYFSPIERTVIVEPKFDNVVSFIPDAKVASGRPINVLLYLDNSNSVVFAKEQIKSALDELIKTLTSLNATIGIYGLGDVTSNVVDFYYYDASGAKLYFSSNSHLAVPDGFKDYYYEDTFYNSAPYAKHSGQDPNYFLSSVTSSGSAVRIFEFKADDNVATREKKRQAILNLVDNLFSKPDEAALIDAPLCSLLRQLEIPGALNHFDMNPMSLNAVVLLTNENDESTNSACLRQKSTKWMQTPKTTYYRAKVSRQTLTVNLSFPGSMDGAPYSYKNIYIGSQNFPYRADFATTYAYCVQAFTENADVAKVESELASRYGYKAGAGYVVGNICNGYVQNQYLTIPTNMDAKDFCANWNKQKEQNSLQGFVPDSCSIVDVSSGGPGNASGSSTSYSLMGKSTNIVDAVYESLKNKTSLENFFFMPIVHPDATSCTMTQGSQVGSRYVDLAKKPGIKSSLVPICASKYSDRLEELASWTEASGVNDIELPIAVAKNMKGVEIVKNGKAMPMVLNTDYQLSNRILIFKAGLLSPNDVVRVYLK